MYSREERMKAVKLYFQYDRQVAPVLRELGYPSRGALRRWVAEFEATGDVHAGYRRERHPSKYSEAQKRAAVDYYLTHGRNLQKTVRALGYPNRDTLRQWLNERVEDRALLRTGRVYKPSAKLSEEEKKEAVIDLCSREGQAREVAKKYGVTRAALYRWKSQLLGSGSPVKRRSANGGPQSSRDTNELESEVESLRKQVEDLRSEVHRLQLERDVLAATAAILKKEGADPAALSNREKSLITSALLGKYRLRDLLRSLGLAKSSYFYQKAAMAAPDKLAAVRERIRIAFTQSERRYGYRRIHAVLRRDGITISEKVVRRLMREGGLVTVGRKRRKYASYRGELSPAVPNVIDRDFSADAPNEKWVTDITEFPLPAGKVYLSPIIDCFDGMVVTWSIGTRPNAEMVNTMLDHALATLRPGERPVLHTDRGAHYRWPGWLQRVEAAGLVRSMSRKACTADNAACEGFFGRIKSEMFYGRSWRGVSVRQFIEILDDYLRWYNQRRIKMSLGAMSPMEYRESLSEAS